MLEILAHKNERPANAICIHGMYHFAETMKADYINIIRRNVCKMEQS